MGNFFKVVTIVTSVLGVISTGIDVINKGYIVIGDMIGEKKENA